MILKTRSILDKEIRLTDGQWRHIQGRHPEMKDQVEKIEETLTNPDFVLYAESEDSYQYYRRFSKTPVTNKFMLLIVKHLNGDGFIITSFFVSKSRRTGRELICGE